MYPRLLVIYYSGSRNTMDCKTAGRFQMSLSHEMSCTQSRVERILHCLQEDANWFLIFKTFMPNVFYTLVKDSVRNLA